MKAWGKLRCGSVLIAATGVALLATGCNSETAGRAQPSTTSAASIAAEVPQGFDPCNDIPSNVLDSLDLDLKIPANYSDPPIKWRGCQWVRSEYYGVSVRVTNATLSSVRDRHFEDTKELTVVGRAAVASRQAPDHPDRQCTVDVEVKGGSLEIFLTKAKAQGEGGAGDLDACDMARDVAEKVVPALPQTL